MTIQMDDVLPGIPDPSAPTRRYSERDMLDALHTRYSRVEPPRPPRYVVAEHVRAACGYGGISFDGGFHSRTMRTADFIAQDTWEAQGLALHGHEVKVSRSDWLTELADPSKAEAIKRFCDYWWLVVPSDGIVRDDLPDGWGLLTLNRVGVLRIKRRAPRLTPDPIPATFRASLMRAVARTARNAA